jgi:hypothetical protein
MMRAASGSLVEGYVLDEQIELHRLQKSLNLPVIVLEDFFVEQMKNELLSIGYTSKSYYHASFVIGSLPADFKAVEQDIVYKAVTDTFTTRQWSLDDEILHESFRKKGIAFPHQFDATCMQKLKEKKQNILGAEILVIEATKI